MKHSLKWLAMLLAILTCITALAVSFVGCTDGGPDTESDTSTDTTGETDATQTGNKLAHTFRVQSAGGLPLEKVTVAAYADEALSDVKGFGITDAEGVAKIELPAGSKYYVAVTNLPAGYTPETSYVADTTDVTISVKSSVISDSNLSGVSYKLGDVIRDFTLTDSDGREITLSKLLEEKDMVLLNFWYTTCSYCVKEFPYMNTVYGQYKDNIEIVALNPTGESNKEIADFKEGYGLTFPMVNDTTAMSTAFGVEAFPTSVVVDRYGVICLIETGGILSETPFVHMFEYFTGEDYKQQLFEELDALIPPVVVDKVMPSSDEIAAVLNKGDITVTYRAEESEYASSTWPFIIGEKNGTPCIVPSNTGVDASYSIMYADVTMKKGDVLAVDYWASTEPNNDALVILVDAKDIYRISGNTDNKWNTCFPYVALEDGTYEIAFCYLKDSSDSAGDDTVYLKDLRIVKESDITTPSYIFRYAANDLKEDHSGYEDYVDVVYNEADGYYHVGTADGPLLLADLMKATRFSGTSIYTHALNEQIVLDGKDYLEDLIPFASYASNATIYGLCPVDKDLKELLEITAKAIGLEHDNPDQWLQICCYYSAYGTNGVQLEDPTKGVYSTDSNNKAMIDPKRTFTAVLGENEMVYDRMIMPRGLLAKFTPTESGAYRFESKSDYMTDGWIFAEDGTTLYIYEGGERLYTDENNVSMVIYCEAGKNYYVDICFYDMEATGTIPYVIEYLGASYKQFMVASPGFFTFPDGTEASGGVLDEMAEIIAGGIEVVLGTDGFYHEKLADGSEGSILYADFTNTTGIFTSDSIKTLIEGGAFDFTKSESDEYILSFVAQYGDKAEEELRKLWGEDFDAQAENHKLYEVLDGKMHGTGTDMTQDIRAYLEKVIESEENPELDGCVPVDATLASLLQKLMDKYTFAGVDNSWIKLCYYYRQLG